MNTFSDMLFCAFTVVDIDIDFLFYFVVCYTRDYILGEAFPQNKGKFFVIGAVNFELKTELISEVNLKNLCLRMKIIMWKIN